jgi:hypothetical protein
MDELKLGTIICMMQDNPHLKFTNGDIILRYDISSEYLKITTLDGMNLGELWRLNFNDKWEVTQ